MATTFPKHASATWRHLARPAHPVAISKRLTLAARPSRVTFPAMQEKWRVNPPRLTPRTSGPILRVSGCAFARPITAERIRKMTHPFWEALGRPIFHAIYPTNSQRSGAVEADPATEQRSDGRPVRRAGWPTMAKVHGRRDTARNQPAHSFLRDGTAGAGLSDIRSNLGENARGRRDDRDGRNVARAHGDLALRVIRDALRTAALAPTDQDALDITGEALRRLADLARAEVSA